MDTGNETYNGIVGAVQKGVRQHMFLTLILNINNLIKMICVFGVLNECVFGCIK